MQRAMPVLAQAYGEIDSRAAPTLKDSPLPVKSMSIIPSGQFITRITDKELGSPRTSSYNQKERANAADTVRENHLGRKIVCTVS
jgi:hypothetical protein